MITLWHITTLENWKEHLKKGIIRTHRDMVLIEFNHPDSDKPYLEAYDWMRHQMYKRLAKKPYHNTAYPVWAWYQYGGEQKRKPDLRESTHLDSKTKGVRIEFQVDEKDVLLSDFDLWHHAYSSTKYFLHEDREKEEKIRDEIEEELNRICGKLWDFPSYSYPKDIAMRIEKSWEKMFDMNLKHWDQIACSTPKRIQACVWEIPLDSIVKVQEFVAR